MLIYLLSGIILTLGSAYWIGRIVKSELRKRTEHREKLLFAIIDLLSGLSPIYLLGALVGLGLLLIAIGVGAVRVA